MMLMFLFQVLLLSSAASFENPVDPIGTTGGYEYIPSIEHWCDAHGNGKREIPPPYTPPQVRCHFLISFFFLIVFLIVIYVICTSTCQEQTYQLTNSPTHQLTNKIHAPLSLFFSFSGLDLQHYWWPGAWKN